jgi:hypothetical protein
MAELRDELRLWWDGADVQSHLLELLRLLNDECCRCSALHGPCDSCHLNSVGAGLDADFRCRRSGGRRCRSSPTARSATDGGEPDRKNASSNHPFSASAAQSGDAESERADHREAKHHARAMIRGSSLNSSQDQVNVCSAARSDVSSREFAAEICRHFAALKSHGGVKCGRGRQKGERKFRGSR